MNQHKRQHSPINPQVKKVVSI